jgi:hypothetical protein
METNFAPPPGRARPTLSRACPTRRSLFFMRDVSGRATMPIDRCVIPARRRLALRPRPPRGWSAPAAAIENAIPFDALREID